VRTEEVEKEDESRDSRISRVEGVEAAFDFVPRLELSMKRFDEIIGNVVFERFDANVFGFGEKAFNRDFVSGITVADNAIGSAKLPDMVQNRMSLRGITVRR